MIGIAVQILGSVSAPALAQSHFGLAVGEYGSEHDVFDNEETFAIRGGYRFRPKLGFEASLSQAELEDGFSEPFFDVFSETRVELTHLDLSLQWFPGSHLVVFGGPGVARVDAKERFRLFGDTFSASDTAEILTFHAGIAYDWQIKDRFFIRPEARVRRHFGDSPPDFATEENLAATYRGTDYEAGLTLGVRLGRGV